MEENKITSAINAQKISHVRLQYSKAGKVVVFVFFFITATIAGVITGKVYGFIYSNIFYYLMIQALYYMAAYFLSKKVISEGYDPNEEFKSNNDIFRRNVDDYACGIFPKRD